jgi:hypothetical protein
MRQGASEQQGHIIVRYVSRFVDFCGTGFRLCPVPRATPALAYR